MSIDGRFNGPRNSANGGYACGVIAEGIDGVASVRLKIPPPLNQLMTLVGDGGSASLMHRETIVGEAMASDLDITVPDLPTIEQAEKSVRGYAGFDYHPLATCFVCGTERKTRDGLELFTGPVEGLDVVASPWIPDETLTDSSGKVDRKVIWAALDCPSYFDIPGTPKALLGELTADIKRIPEVSEPLVAVGWHKGSEGRKHFCGSALVTGEGEIIGKASAVWIEVLGDLPT